MGEAPPLRGSWLLAVILLLITNAACGGLRAGLIGFLAVGCYMWQRNDSAGRLAAAHLWASTQLGVSKWPLIEFMLARRFVTWPEEHNKGRKSLPSFTQEESKGVKYKYLYIIAGQTE